MKINITPYTTIDHEAIKQIYCQILQNEWELTTDLTQMIHDLDQSISEEVVLVARQNGTIIGFISWYEPDAFIHHLYIKSEFRNLGVGKNLIHCALGKLRHPVRLKCLKNNKKALDFYFGIGWYLAGEGISNEGDFFIMEYSNVENKNILIEDFKLHERLQNDCYILGKLPLSYLLLNNNAEVPWFILVPETNKLEVHELNMDTQRLLFQEAMDLSKMLKNILNVDKINMGAIGNLVPQLHFHVIGRQKQDFCWPKVVWGAEGFRPYKSEELQHLIGIVRSSFGNQLKSIED